MGKYLKWDAATNQKIRYFLLVGKLNNNKVSMTKFTDSKIKQNQNNNKPYFADSISWGNTWQFE